MARLSLRGTWFLSHKRQFFASDCHHQTRILVQIGNKGLKKYPCTKGVQWVKIAHSFLHLGSSTSDPKRILRIAAFYSRSFSTNHESWFEHTAQLSSNA